MLSFSGFAGKSFAFQSAANWCMSFNNRPSHSNIMPSDETTSLVPEVNSLNWRRKSCKHFSWGCFFGIVYSLLLVTDAVLSIRCKILVIAQHGDKTAEMADIVDSYATCFLSDVIDTLNCWIFLGIVTTSSHFVGCCATLRNLIRLPRFWTLLFYFALYVTSKVIMIFAYFYFDPVAVHGIGNTITDVPNAFTVLGMVVILNQVKVQNLVQGHSRYKYLLKGALFVFFIHYFCNMITAIVNVFFVINYSNSDKVTSSVTSFIILPFFTKITDLIWTKIFHDDKCIIGKHNSNSFTRQNTLINEAV